MVVVNSSPETPIYNCIAWAAFDTSHWWWPNDFWPAGARRNETIGAFIAAYNTIGYDRCDNEDYEEGYEKIAIFADENDIPQHAARQLTSGRWTSKLGQGEDVEHDLHEIRDHVLYLTRHNDEPIDYGTVKVILKRPIR